MHLNLKILYLYLLLASTTANIIGYDYDCNSTVNLCVQLNIFPLECVIFIIWIVSCFESV